jgi:hypothetical protein
VGVVVVEEDRLLCLGGCLANDAFELIEMYY